MIFPGMKLHNPKKNIEYLVCHVSRRRNKAAIYDLAKLNTNKHLSKPESIAFSDLIKLIKHESLEEVDYIYPPVMTMTDRHIKEIKNKPEWIIRRDKKFAEIEPLAHEHIIEQYLYSHGIAEEISKLQQDSEWNTAASFHHVLNRYIVLGGTPNALLPFGWDKCGLNYKHAENEFDSVVKKGCGGAKNEKCLSKTRGVNKNDKRNIKKIAALFKRKRRKFLYTQAFRVYSKYFERYVIEREVNSKKITYQFPFEEERRISYNQFRYHFKKLIGHEGLIKLDVGDLEFAKDHEDRQGSSKDGVHAANHRWEVDATVLDCYVRYPFDTSGQYSMGRPVLYLVIDVYSTMIVGMYLGFDGPNWQGVSQALTNACLSKVEFAQRFGVPLTEDDWPAQHVPSEISIDNGNEYPDAMLRNILKSEIGVEVINLLAVYRGDAKGVVERKFGVINDQVIHFIPGAIPKNPRRDEQHPSNEALYDYDSLVGLLITEIIYHNQSANRLKRCSFSAIVNNIGITPQAIYLNSLDERKEFNRETSKKNEHKIRWAFMPEELATVRKDCVYFNGVEYHNEYFTKSKSYSKARHEGAFKIPVKRVRDSINHIWHKTDGGKYIKLAIKNVNNENPLVDLHWEAALHLMEQFKVKVHQNEVDSLFKRAYWDSISDPITEANQAEVNLSPKPTRKSMQPGIKERQGVQKELLKVKNQIELEQGLKGNTESEIITVNEVGSFDKLLYDE